MKNENRPLVAKTLYGFEPILAKELRQLGAVDVKEGNRVVTFKGDLGFVYKANLCLRTALNILVPIKKTNISNQEDLYRSMQEVDWPSIFSVEQTFAIQATVFGSLFEHSLFVAQKAKDAIVDQFRLRFKKRPDVNTTDPDIRIQLHLVDDFLQISMDSSGRSLHLRGYKQSTNIAPINEVLAAGLLLHSHWNGLHDFLDPMCGSGTIAIEAAMIACRIPANINRTRFAFKNWNNYNEDLFETIVNSSLNKSIEHNRPIYAMDKAPSAVRKTQENVNAANLADYIQVSRADFFRSPRSTENRLHLVFNPPYGERLPIDYDIFYGKIGDTLKKEYSGCEAWFISSNLDAIKHVGLRTSRKIKLFNGSLESRLVCYQMYEGSKKMFSPLDSS
ncbi:MAG: RNA methyltransferase [Flavobacteriaceae bacterium]|nr:RNA methyltransferase [Flavobacteriaceae bacterium]